MAKGYWVTQYKEIRDADKMAAYAKLAGPVVAEHGGVFITRGVATKAYEAGLVERTTVIEFSSVDAAIACHDSDGYQAALKALDGGVTRDMRVVEGVE
jgi:uncharacterized protein (DUF1330 family)